MASKGNWKKVDGTVGDQKQRGRDQDDWYSLKPDFMPVFSLGKLSEEDYDGTCSTQGRNRFYCMKGLW